MERRVALMHVAGASPYVTAELLAMHPDTVEAILHRPRVARFALLLHGFASDNLKEGLEDLNKAFKEKASRAFELECIEMEAMHDLGNDEDLKPSARIRAKMGVTFTARDILDRAGYRAPQKVYTYGNNEISPEAAEALASAARELRALDHKTIDVTPSAEGTRPHEPHNGNGNAGS